jgi:translation initiation factor eIF-2B subunit delta
MNINNLIRSSVVEKVLLTAKERGIDFKVIIIDARPLLEGRKMLTVLNAAGIPCTYAWINGLCVAMARVSL